MAASISPGFVNVNVPSKGETETVTITNNGGQRIGFKLKGTKLEKFEVNPVFGFVAPKGKAEVKVTAKKVDAPLKDKDHITICVAVAPDTAPDPKGFWAKGPNEPKAPKRYKLGLKMAKDGKANAGTQAEEKRASESDSDSEDGGGAKPGGGSEKKPKAASAKPFVFVDDEKTEPPEDLQEVPIFQEFFYRKYD